MRTFDEVRFWATALLLLVAIILLLTYRKTKGKGFLLAYAILFLIANVGVYVQYALARAGIQSTSTDTINMFLSSLCIAGTGCFLGYFVAMKPSDTDPA